MFIDVLSLPIFLSHLTKIANLTNQLKASLGHISGTEYGYYQLHSIGSKGDLESYFLEPQSSLLLYLTAFHFGKQLFLNLEGLKAIILMSTV